MNHLSLLLQPTTNYHKHRAYLDNWFSSYHSSNTFWDLPPPLELRETHFALNHCLTPRIAALVQALGKAKKDRKPRKVLLAVKVSFISVISFAQWETQYCQLFPKARQSCLSTESPIFRYFQWYSMKEVLVCWVIIQPVTSVFHLTT